SKSFSTQLGAASFASVNFALEQMVSDNIEVVVAGQTGLGQISPQRLETQASVTVGDDHQLTLTIGYAHLPTRSRGIASFGHGLDQYSVQATDRWHIAGPVVILYGFDYYRYDGLSQASRISPRVNFDLQITPRNQLFAAIYSPTGA